MVAGIGSNIIEYDDINEFRLCGLISGFSIFFFLDLETEPLPEEIPAVEQLIADHKEFMENTARRQTEVDRACKPKMPPAGSKEARKPSRTAKTPV